MPIPTPFKSAHEQLNATFSEYDGWLLPQNYGDPNTENHALEAGIAAFDLSSFAKFTIKDADTKPLLEQLFPNQLPEPDKWTWAQLNPDSPKLRIAQTNNQYMIFAQPQQRKPLLDTILQTSKDTNLTGVKITDITEKTGMIGAYGPNAITAINNILPFDLSEIPPSGVKTLSFFMMNITIIRGTWLNTQGIELLCPKSVCSMAAAAITKYHKRENITPAGMDCLLEAMAGTGLTA